MSRSVVLFWLIFPLIAAKKASDSFTEELYIKPLQTGHVYGHFQFTTRWDVNALDSNSYNHFNLFPKSIGEIIAKFHVQELHLSLTQGLWKEQKWGYSIDSAPPGVQLYVWFKDSVINVDDVWKDLTNALSGQFCASLNFVDGTNTVNPKWSFRPVGVHHGNLNNSLLRYASLPRENVCTENLTPWKKLLPCGSKQGLSTLLSAVQLFNSHYNSLQVSIHPVCQTKECAKTSLVLRQSVSVVLKPPQFNQRKQNWSLFRLFGLKLSSTCSLAERSTVMIDVSSNKSENIFHVIPKSSEKVNLSGADVLLYNLKDFADKTGFNVEAKYAQNIPSIVTPSPILHAHRFIAGIGQEYGEIRCQIHNNEHQKINIVYQEVIPWFIRIYLSKLKIISINRHGHSNRRVVITPLSQHYKPSKDRQSPAHLEIIFQLLPHSMTEISLEFTRGFLKWTEHPPDANHGFYINAAVISAHINSSKSIIIPSTTTIYEGFENSRSDNIFLRFYTETLLISLPTPDFSMPYNVICLACTVVALAFGPLHNITTKRLKAVTSAEQTGLLSKIKSFIKPKKAENVQTKSE